MYNTNKLVHSSLHIHYWFAEPLKTEFKLSLKDKQLNMWLKQAKLEEHDDRYQLILGLGNFWFMKKPIKEGFRTII